MSREFLLPDLGSGLKEGEIVQWRVTVGDVVTTDDLLVDIETEKAVIEVPVPYDGTVIALAAEAGELVKVGSMLAVFDTGQASAEQDQSNEAKVQKPVAVQAPVVETAVAPAPAPANERIKAMPSVRRISLEFEVDLALVTGSGRDGRVTKGDVLAFIKNRTAGVEELPVKGCRRIPATTTARPGAAHRFW